MWLNLLDCKLISCSYDHLETVFKNFSHHDNLHCYYCSHYLLSFYDAFRVKIKSATIVEQMVNQ